jgi:hypothetical protein
MRDTFCETKPTEELQPWIDLAYAIVAVAVKDYRLLLKACKRMDAKPSKGAFEDYYRKQKRSLLRSVETFFESQWCNELLQGRLVGQDIIHTLKQQEGVAE